MESTTNNPILTFMPEQRKYTISLFSSLLISVILVAVSLTGLLMPGRIYSSQSLREFFMTNDLINLIIGLPMLLGSMWLVLRGKLIGMLFWLGSMMYVFYNYIAYMVAMPVSWIYPMYGILVFGSLFLFLYITANMDKEPVRGRLSGHVNEKLSAGLLFVFGVGFLLRALSLLADPVLRGKQLPTTDLSILLADIVLSFSWIVSGVLLWQRKALGYLTGGALLVQGATLFIGLILVLLINPILTDARFNPIDVIIVLIMSVICNIPFGLYVRGVLKTEGI